MKRKEISRIIAGTLILAVALNVYPDNAKNVLATEIVDSKDNEDSSSVDDSSEESNDDTTNSEIKSTTSSQVKIDLGSDDIKNSEVTSTTSAQVTVDDIDENSVYLSNIDYDNKMSKTDYKYITKDSNTDGNKIKLLVNGEVTEFYKGMGAHATSTLVYDVSSYSDVYTRLIAYLGVDYAQKGKGNGVKFTIYTSQDGNVWTSVKETGVMKPDANSEFIDINIKGVKYIKLYANDNGNQSNDHAVYGDLRLVKEGYDISSEKLTCIKTVSEYDTEIKSQYTASTAIEGDFKKLILERTFVNRYGYNIIQQIAKISSNNKRAIEYIFENEEVLELFVTGGEKESGSYSNSLSAWCKLYENYSSDFFNKGYLKMAVATSIAYSKDIVFWTGSSTPSDPVVRYDLYKQLIEDGLMDQGGSSKEFFELPVELMRWVMNNMIHDDEIMWLMDKVLDTKNAGKDYKDAYTYISYTSGFNYSKSKYHSYDLYDGADLKGKTWYDIWNEKWDIDKLDDYSNTGIHRLWMVFQDGAVCGGLSKTYTNIGQIFGKPAAVCGQPGHAISLEYNYSGNHTWTIQNDISGWLGTEKGERMPLGWGSTNWDAYYNVNYILLAQRAFDDYDNLVKAMYFNYLADVYKDDNNTKMSIYERALEVQSFNLDSMVGLINCYKADNTKTSADYTDLARRIVKEYTFYPQQMLDVLNLVKSYITDDNDIVEVDLLKTNALTKATQAKTGDCAQPKDCITIAKGLLGQNSTELASFSFDGENAGKIVLNEKYDSSSVRVRYSLDGGTTWKQSDEHSIKLTDEELASITSDKDIIVGLVGTDVTYTIDIKDGVTITNSILYKNDLENRFFGDLTGLQYSTDGGTTWYDYTSSTRFPGRIVSKVRYKAKGVYLPSGVAQYTFTADTDTAERKYISIDNITLDSFSTQQNDTSSAATNMIDGRDDTGWHTKYNYTDPDKFYTIKLDTVRFITSIEYVPGGANGRLRDGEIYTSIDGKEWVKSGSVKELNNNNGVKTINLDKPTAAKYVKIVALKTWGNHTYEQDMYFSGMTFNFYEDTTKEYKADAEIEYENVEGSVVAKLVLPSGCTAVGDSEHSFSSNGTFEFKYTDANGVEQSIIASVDSFDDSDNVSASLKITRDDDTLTAKLLNEDGSEFTTDAAVN